MFLRRHGICKTWLMTSGRLAMLPAAEQVPWGTQLRMQHRLALGTDRHCAALDTNIAASPCKDAAGDWVLALLGREEAKGF